MGRFATRFVEYLSKSDEAWLEETWKHHPSHVTRCRAHAILLSNKRRSIFELSLIFGVTDQAILIAAGVDGRR